jgi:hypothetical protein
VIVPLKAGSEWREREAARLAASNDPLHYRLLPEIVASQRGFFAKFCQGFRGADV